MSDVRSRRNLPWLVLAVMLAICPVLRGAPSNAVQNTLSWRTNENRVTADIRSWDLDTLLQHIAAATGWQVYVDPGAKYNVSAKFKDLRPGEALRLLLPTLTAVLMPETNRSARLLVFRTSAQDATRLVKGVAKREDPTAKPIANEVVVTLKPGANIDELAKKLGAKVLGRADGLNSYRLSFETAEAAASARESLRRDPNVESIDNNFYVQRPENTDATAYAAGNPLALRPTEGRPDCNNYTIGLIDTAVQATGGPLDAFLLPTISVAGESQPPGDQPTHATSMFETILRGVSLNDKETPVKVLPVDVYGPQQMTTTFDVANGISQAMAKGAGIVNLSLGSSGDSDLLRRTIKDGADKGVIFLAAAGNEPGTEPTYPAAYPEVLAVTSGTRDGTVAPYANSGDFVDLAAPGSSVVNFNGRSWLVRGTSASTAYASGLAAGVYDCGQMNRTQLLSTMQGLLPVKRQP